MLSAYQWHHSLWHPRILKIFKKTTTEKILAHKAMRSCSTYVKKHCSLHCLGSNGFIYIILGYIYKETFWFYSAILIFFFNFTEYKKQRFQYTKSFTQLHFSTTLFVSTVFSFLTIYLFKLYLNINTGNTQHFKGLALAHNANCWPAKYFQLHSSISMYKTTSLFNPRS